MFSFQKLFFFATVLTAITGPAALAAPLPTHDMTGMAHRLADISGADSASLFRRDQESDAIDAMMNDPNFNPFAALKSVFSAAKNIVTTVAPKVAQVAQVLKPIVDTVSKVASVTPLAPITNVIDDAVDIAAGSGPAAPPAAREDLD